MLTVNLAWNANTEADLAGYRLYRGFGTAALTFLISVPKTATTYSDTTVPNLSQVVNYELTATDLSANESPRSNRASVTVDATPPQAPSGLTAVLA